MTCCKYGAYNVSLHINILTCLQMYLYILTFLHVIMEHKIYIIFDILYEICDSVLQFVHFSANSHNSHTNTIMTFFNILIFSIYGL